MWPGLLMHQQLHVISACRCWSSIVADESLPSPLISMQGAVLFFEQLACQ